jgi:uncharacterized protein YlaI
MNNKVAPTLDYLRKLKEDGRRVIDVRLTSFDQDTRRMRVFLADGEERDFYIDDSSQVMPHYREAIEYSEYGPKGLANLIYLEALQFARKQKLKNEEIEVIVSQECFDRVGREIEEYLHYGFSFRMNPNSSGMGYSFQRKK